VCIDDVGSLRLGEQFADEAAIAQRVRGDAVKKPGERCLAGSFSPSLSDHGFCRVEDASFLFGPFEKGLGSQVAAVNGYKKAGIEDHEKKWSISASSAAVEGPASATHASTNSLMASRRAVSFRKRSSAIRTSSDLPP